MSLILDALRKSEQERATLSPASGAPAVVASTRASRGVLLATAGIAVLLGAGAAVAWRIATTPDEADLAPISVPVVAPPAPVPAAPPAPIPHGPSLTEQLAVPASRPIEAAPVVQVPAQVPWLRQLPEAFRRSLPPLAINIHVYSPVAADCVLYINNRQYRPGDSIAPGLRLEKIVEDGAVLRYAGRDFKLPRPN